MAWKLVGLWIPMVLWYLWAIVMVSAGVYGLGMKHSKLWVAILIKALHDSAARNAGLTVVTPAVI